MSNQVNEKNEHVNFKIPIYQSLTKDIMIAGIPLTFALFFNIFSNIFPFIFNNKTFKKI